MKQLVNLTITLLFLPFIAEPSHAQKPELIVQTGHYGEVESVAFSADGKLLASGSTDNMINLWDASNWKKLRTLKGHSGAINSVAFSPAGTILASGGDDKNIKLWDVTSGTELRTLKASGDDDIESLPA